MLLIRHIDDIDNAVREGDWEEGNNLVRWGPFYWRKTVGICLAMLFQAKFCCHLRKNIRLYVSCIKSSMSCKQGCSIWNTRQLRRSVAYTATVCRPSGSKHPPFLPSSQSVRIPILFSSLLNHWQADKSVSTIVLCWLNWISWLRPAQITNNWLRHQNRD